MAVKIRLMRMGKRKQPTYRVVVADSRRARNGRFIEVLGQYQPRRDPSVFEVDEERTLHWLKVGALPTEQVSKLLDATGVWTRFEAETGHPPATKAKISSKVRVAKNPRAEEPAAAVAASGSEDSDSARDGEETAE